MATVTLYVNNKLDAAVELEARELAAEFVAAALEGVWLVQRASVELAYRYWLSGPEGRSSTWDESDWTAMVDGLVEVFNADTKARDKVWALVCP
jgi:hypothetical protein